MSEVISVGYEGVALDAFVQDLLARGVRVLVDVRLNAISRRPGFSKSALSRALAEVGIEYRHFRVLVKALPVAHERQARGTS